MINVNVDEQIKIISKGADEVIALDELKEKLKEGKPLTVKRPFRKVKDKKTSYKRASFRKCKDLRKTDI